MCCLVKYVVFQHYSLLFSRCIKGTIFFNTYSFVPAFMQTTLMFLKVCSAFCFLKLYSHLRSCVLKALYLFSIFTCYITVSTQSKYRVFSVLYFPAKGLNADIVKCEVFWSQKCSALPYFFIFSFSIEIADQDLSQKEIMITRK